MQTPQIYYLDGRQKKRAILAENIQACFLEKENQNIYFVPTIMTNVYFFMKIVITVNTHV